MRANPTVRRRYVNRSPLSLYLCPSSSICIYGAVWTAGGGANSARDGTAQSASVGGVRRVLCEGSKVSVRPRSMLQGE